MMPVLLTMGAAQMPPPARMNRAVGAAESARVIHCVGSRDARYNPYCSSVCCMYSLKLAHLIKEHTGAEVYSFYIDMRTRGAGNNRAVSTAMASSFLNGPGVRYGTGGR